MKRICSALLPILVVLLLYTPANAFLYGMHYDDWTLYQSPGEDSGLATTARAEAIQNSGKFVYRFTIDDGTANDQYSYLTFDNFPAYKYENADYVYDNECPDDLEVQFKDPSAPNQVRIYITDLGSGSYKIEYKDVGTGIMGTDTSLVMTYDQFMALYGSNSSDDNAAQEAAQAESSRQASRQTSQMISTRVLNVFSARPTPSRPGFSPTQTGFNGDYSNTRGMASGDAPVNWAVWGMGSYSSFSNTKTGFRSDGNVSVLMGGADRLFMDDQMVLGVAGGYENSFASAKDDNETYQGTGFALTPYMAYRVTDEFMIKALAGITFIDYDNTGKSDHDAMRTMTDLSAEYSWLFSSFMLSAEAGFMYVNESANKGNTDSFLGEGRIGTTLTYAATDDFMPYVKATYHLDMIDNKDSKLDSDDITGALGINWYNDSWVFSAETSYTFDRTHEEIYGGSLVLRYEF